MNKEQNINITEEELDQIVIQSKEDAELFNRAILDAAWIPESFLIGASSTIYATLCAQRMLQLRTNKLQRNERAMTGVTSHEFELLSLFGVPVLFTEERIDRSFVPSHLHCYDIRHDDAGQGNMVELKDHVTVNHFGTIISRYAFAPHNHGAVIQTTKDGIAIGENDYNYLTGYYTINDYLAYYAELESRCGDWWKGEQDNE